MRKLTNASLLDIGLHVVVVGWFIILLQKAGASGIHLTAVEFAIPVLGALVLLLLLKLIRTKVRDEQSPDSL